MPSVLGTTALGLSDEQAMLMEVARNFVRDQSPIERVRAHLESDSGFDPAVWNEMVAMGWSGVALPEAVGGAEMGFGAVVPIIEALGFGVVGTPLINTILAGQLLLDAETQGVDEVLTAIASGSVATVAFLDGGDWGAQQRSVVVQDDGSLSGRKYFVGDAQVAAFFVVVCDYKGEPALAVVDRAAVAPEAITANALIDLTKRSANVDFSGVRPAQLVTGASVSRAVELYRLYGALLVATEAVGTSHRCLAALVDYMTTRKQFGKLIGAYQALKHPTVDIYCGVEDARSFVYHAATLIDRGTEARDIDIACRMAKASATDLMSYAGDRSVQFHGGFGFTWDCDSTLFIRRAQWTRQAFGDAGHHRKHLARLLLDAD